MPSPYAAPRAYESLQFGGNPADLHRAPHGEKRRNLQDEVSEATNKNHHHPPAPTHLAASVSTSTDDPPKSKVSDRRRSQNRNAQKNFRDRKEKVRPSLVMPDPVLSAIADVEYLPVAHVDPRRARRGLGKGSV